MAAETKDQTQPESLIFVLYCFVLLCKTLFQKSAQKNKLESNLRKNFGCPAARAGMETPCPKNALLILNYYVYYASLVF